MTAEEKKEFVTKTWTTFLSGDAKAVSANFSDNVSWLVPGNMPGVSGVRRGKDEIFKIISGAAAVFPEGLQCQVNKAFADGDTVILELTNRGKVSNGKLYDNEYCFVFELENGKIRRIREYLDTQKAKEIILG